jgi:hypothetical protein
VAFASMASKTGSSSPGELLMTPSTSEVAVCCSSASARAFRGLSEFAGPDFELRFQLGGQ